MRNFSKSICNKEASGAVLFQVLLGLGLMVLMAPLILNQIKKYNEEIQREEVISDMEKLQRAVSSFVVFERDKTTIPEGVTCWKDTSSCPDTLNIGDESVIIKSKKMKAFLNDYLGNDRVKTSNVNGFGQEYSFITNRSRDEVQAVVIASCEAKGCIDELTLNGIGQFLFDKGSIMAEDGQFLGDLKMDEILKSVLAGLAKETKAGILIMYVNDAFFQSDFLHLSEMPGDPVKARLFNTMLVDLYMANHDIKNVKNFYANGMSIDSKSNINLLSVDKALVKSKDFTIGNFLEYNNSDGGHIVTDNNKFPVYARDKLGTNGGSIYMNSLKVLNDEPTEVDSINLNTTDLKTQSLLIQKSADISGDFIVNRWNSPEYTEVQKIVANRAVASSKVDKNILGNIFMNNVSSDDAFIYIADEQKDSHGNIELINDVTLNLSGTSEVDDIKFFKGGSVHMMSDVIFNIAKTIRRAIHRYAASGG